MHTRTLLLLATLAVAGCSNGSTTDPSSAARITVSGGRSVRPTQTLQLTATAYDGTGAAMTNPGTFAWTSSATSVATVDQTGKVTAVAAGQSTIAAALGTLSGSYLLTVDPSLTMSRAPVLP